MKKLFILVIVFFLILVMINVYMMFYSKKYIKSPEDIALKDIDCILVLGAGVRRNSPSPMLEDRLLTSMELYNLKKAPKILVSGDHEYNDYDEVNVMKNYLKENNIPSKDIFMDHAGLSTYDSIYRAKKIFKVNKVIIITQEYHLYRAIYISKKLDMEVYGVVADKKEYFGQIKRDIREFYARIKDFFKCIMKPDSTYLGEVFPINGDGDKTND